MNRQGLKGEEGKSFKGEDAVILRLEQWYVKVNAYLCIGGWLSWRVNAWFSDENVFENWKNLNCGLRILRGFLAPKRFGIIHCRRLLR